MAGRDRDKAGGRARRPRTDAILIIDEPGIAAAGLRVTEAQFWDPLRASARTWGVHICGAVAWPLIDAAQPDLVSFDLARYGVDPSGQRMLSRLISRGGRVIWGVFDPLAPQPVATATRQITSACASLGAGVTESRLLAASLVSAGCGTGFASVDDELTVAASVRGVAARVRAGTTPRGSTPVQVPIAVPARVAIPSPVPDLMKSASSLLSHPAGAGS